MGKRTSEVGTGRAGRLMEVLRGAESVLVLTHDIPDPDAIASGWGMVELIQTVLRIPARLLAGGIIARAENQALVEILEPPLTLTSERFSPGPSEAVVLVDTAFAHRIANLEKGRVLEAVIDHHLPEKAGKNWTLPFRFRDIRPRVLSTSTIVSSYLRQFSIVPSAALATALVYGIESDAKGSQCPFSRTDRTAVSWLSQYSDPELLAQIANPKLSRQYFADLLLALESCFTYGPVAFCFLPSVNGTEAVGETADLLIRCVGVERLLCAAIVGRQMILSARTTDRGGDATKLLGHTVEPEAGTWGGHEHRAGAAIDIGGSAPGIEELESRIRTNWLDATGAPKHRGDRLVAKREILKALR